MSAAGRGVAAGDAVAHVEGDAAAAAAGRADTAAAPFSATKRDCSSAGSPSRAATDRATERAAGNAAPSAARETAAADHEGAAAGEAAAAMRGESKVGEDEDARGGAGRTAGTRDVELSEELLSGTASGTADAVVETAAAKSASTSADEPRGRPAGAAARTVPPAAADAVEGSGSAAISSACSGRARTEVENLNGEQQGKGIRSHGSEAAIVEDCRGQEADALRTAAGVRNDVEEDTDMLSRTAAGAQAGTASPTRCCSVSLQFQTCARVAAVGASPAAAGAPFPDAAASTVAAAAATSATRAAAGDPSPAGESPAVYPAASAALAAVSCPSDEFLCVEKLLHQEELCGDAFLPTKLQGAGVPDAPPSPSSPSLVAAFCAARAAAAAAAGKRARRATAAFCAAACRAEAAPAAKRKAQSSATATAVKAPVSAAASDAAGAAVSSSETHWATAQLAGGAAALPEQISSAAVEKKSRRSSSSSGDNFAGNSGSSSVHSSSRGKRSLEIPPPATSGPEEFCFCDSGEVGNDGAVLLQRILEEVAPGGTATRAAPSRAAAAAFGSDPAAVSAAARAPAGRHLAFAVGAAARPAPAAEAPATVGSASSAAAAATSSVVTSAAGTADGSGPAADAGDSSSRRRWLEKQLLCDYSYRITRRVLLNATERMLLVGTINFLVVLGLSLELSVRCIGVACVYVHHFFDVFSFHRLERKIVASAALLLAWKYAEDTEVSTRNTRKLYELARGIYRVVMQQKAADLRAIREQLLLLTTGSIRRSSGLKGSSGTNDSSRSSGSGEGGRSTLVDNCGDRSGCGNNGGREVEEETVATTESRGYAGETVAAAIRKASGSVSCACPQMHIPSSAVSSPTIRTSTAGASSPPANPCFPHAEFRFATGTHSAVAVHAAADVHPVACAAAAAAPLRSAAASAPAPATAAGESSTFARRAAAAFSVLLAEDVIGDVVSSSRWLLRDDGASFRSLCQKLRVYEAAVLRAIRFDVCPNFIPLPAIRLYVKLFLVKCCWCCLATPGAAAAGRASCSLVTSGRSSCSVTTESLTPCCCTAAELSPSPHACCTTAYTNCVASCLCVSSCKSPSSRCSCRFPNRDAAFFSCCSTSPVAGDSSTIPCCCATDCRCCCSSSYVDSSSSSTCCCSEWPAAGLPYVQLQRRLHAEALQQLLFLCRTPFLIERSPNAVAAACVIKAAIECGLPFLMSAQHQIKLATATWRQLQHRRTIPRATPQQIDRHAQRNRGHQQELTRAKQEAEEQGTSGVEQEKLPALSKGQKLEKGGSSTVGTIGQRAALWALELFDRHVNHFVHAINRPCDSYATDNRCYGNTATAPVVAAASHEITGTAGTRFTQAKAAAAVNKSHEVVYSVDSGEVRRVLAELRLASTWMGELLRVTGAEATSMMQPLSKEVRKKRVKRVKVDESGVPCKGFSALFASSTAAGAPCSPYDKEGVAAAGGGGAASRGDAPVTTSGAARQSATSCRHPATAADCAVTGRAVVGAAGDPPAAASGLGSEAVPCSVEELLLQETVKLGGKQEQTVQRKRLKRCMEYIRNVLGKQPSDDEHFMTALPKPEAKHPLQHTIEEEEVLQLHQRVGQTHSRHVKGNDKFASVY